MAAQTVPATRPRRAGGYRGLGQHPGGGQCHRLVPLSRAARCSACASGGCREHGIRLTGHGPALGDRHQCGTRQPAGGHGRSNITCEVKLADSKAAMPHRAVVYLAEQANDHPEIPIQWNRRR